MAGGYYPAGIEFEDAVHLMSSDPEQFKTEVRSTLNRHVNAVNQMVANGMHFWDYGMHSCSNRVELVQIY